MPWSPLKIKRWTWLSIKTQARILVPVVSTRWLRRKRKLLRSSSPLNIGEPSIPLIITWCRVPGASNLACRGMSVSYRNLTPIAKCSFSTTSPFFTLLSFQILVFCLAYKILLIFLPIVIDEWLLVISIQILHINLLFLLFIDFGILQFFIHQLIFTI